MHRAAIRGKIPFTNIKRFLNLTKVFHVFKILLLFANVSAHFDAFTNIYEFIIVVEQGSQHDNCFAQ